MSKIILLLVVGCVLAAGILISCSEDDPAAPIETNPFTDLSTKDGVVTNLAVSNNLRNAQEFEKLLDDDFMFMFSLAAASGGSTPYFWDRIAEVDAVQNMLATGTGADDDIVSIDLKLTLPTGEWEAYTGDRTPYGETWYAIDVIYDLIVKTESELEYRCLGVEARLVVRWNETLKRWCLVEWWDDVDGSLAGDTGDAGPSTESVTWGEIKSVYADDWGFEDLGEKDDVLLNLDRAYNLRVVTQYEKLLDDNFLYIFSDADYAEGRTPSMWDRAAEVAVTRMIFDPAQQDPSRRVTRIRLTMSYPPDGWIEEAANQSHPDETWWRKTVRYGMIMNFADGWERRGLDLRMEVAIRWDEAKGAWQVVVWRDDIYTLLARAPGDAVVEEVTWGAMKAMFR